jgi:hypothetical protein
LSVVLPVALSVVLSVALFCLTLSRYPYRRCMIRSLPSSLFHLSDRLQLQQRLVLCGVLSVVLSIALSVVLYFVYHFRDILIFAACYALPPSTLFHLPCLPLPSHLIRNLQRSDRPQLQQRFLLSVVLSCLVSCLSSCHSSFV